MSSRNSKHIYKLCGVGSCDYGTGLRCYNNSHNIKETIYGSKNKKTKRKIKSNGTNLKDSSYNNINSPSNYTTPRSNKYLNNFSGRRTKKIDEGVQVSLEPSKADLLYEYEYLIFNFLQSSRIRILREYFNRLEKRFTFRCAMKIRNSVISSSYKSSRSHYNETFNYSKCDEYDERTEVKTTLFDNDICKENIKTKEKLVSSELVYRTISKGIRMVSFEEKFS